MTIRPIGGIEAKTFSADKAVNMAAFYAAVEDQDYGIYDDGQDGPILTVGPKALEKIYAKHGIEN